MISHLFWLGVFSSCSSDFLTATPAGRCYDVLTRHRVDFPPGAMFPPYLIHHNKFFPSTEPGGKFFFVLTGCEAIVIAIVMGVSGSGKTTVGQLLATRLSWEFCDGDDFHPPANIAKMKSGVPLDDPDRRPWLEAMSEEIRRWLGCNLGVVLACSALKASYRDFLVVDPAVVKVVYLKAGFQLVKSRLEARQGHFMPPELLKSQFDILEEPRDAIVVDASKPLEECVNDIVRALSVYGPIT
jgi:gluconokinase